MGMTHFVEFRGNDPFFFFSDVCEVNQTGLLAIVMGCLDYSLCVCVVKK